MLASYHRLTAVVVGCAEWLTTLLFAALIVVTGSQVFSRVALNDSIVGGEEVAKILLFYIVFIAGSIAVHRRAFSAIDLWGWLPGRGRRLLDLLIIGLVAGFQMLALRYGVEMVGLTTTQITPALELPQATIYAAVPVGMCLMLVVTIDQLLAALAGPRDG